MMRVQKKWKKIFEISIGKHFKASIWLIPMIICAIQGGYGQLFLFTHSCAILHESAHILTASLSSVPVSCIRIYPFGICAELEDGYIKSSEKEFVISAAGPICSLILFFIFSLLYKLFNYDGFLYAADVNFAICAVNLIPALPLDGGRMVKALLTLRFGLLRAYHLMLKISRIAIFCLLGAATILFFAMDFNFSLILISAFLLQNLSLEHQAISLTALKEILSSNQKAQSSESLKVKAMCVSEDKPISGILKVLSYDCVFIIYAMDKTSHITKTLTEFQILDALTKYGVRAKYKDI